MPALAIPEGLSVPETCLNCVSLSIVCQVAGRLGIDLTRKTKHIIERCPEMQSELTFEYDTPVTCALVGYGAEALATEEGTENA